MLGLSWTNPPDPDTAYIRFFAVRVGCPDTLRSDPYWLAGENEDGSPWRRSAPGMPDACWFALPPGDYAIGCTAFDFSGNESGQSNIVNGSVGIESAISAPVFRAIRKNRGASDAARKARK